VLLRILINAIVLAITVLVIPFIRFVDPSLLSILFMAAILGVLNALVKPFLQFLLLPLIFASYGLVIVLVNALMLLLLASLFPGFFSVENLLWAFVAGALIGILGTLLENLFGLIPPIVLDEETGLRRRFIDQPVSSLGGASAVPQILEEEQVVIEAPEDERQLIGSEPEVETPGDVVEAESSASEALPSEEGPDEADVSPAELSGIPDAPKSAPGEGPENIIKEEDEG
jgi:putative membrane protein